MEDMTEDVRARLDIMAEGWQQLKPDGGLRKGWMEGREMEAISQW
jgi:hypothetical protein